MSSEGRSQLYPRYCCKRFVCSNSCQLTLHMPLTKTKKKKKKKKVPFLFSSSVRNNLDPLCEFDDAQLWNALEQVWDEDHNI